MENSEKIYSSTEGGLSHLQPSRDQAEYYELPQPGLGQFELSIWTIFDNFMQTDAGNVCMSIKKKCDELMIKTDDISTYQCAKEYSIAVYSWSWERNHAQEARNAELFWMFIKICYVQAILTDCSQGNHQADESLNWTFSNDHRIALSG